MSPVALLLSASSAAARSLNEHVVSQRDVGTGNSGWVGNARDISPQTYQIYIIVVCMCVGVALAGAAFNGWGVREHVRC